MAVITMDEEAARSTAQEAIDCGISAADAINEGLVKGMQVVGEKYEQQEYFIPELLLCSDAMIAGIEILRQHLSKDDAEEAAKVVYRRCPGRYARHREKPRENHARNIWVRSFRSGTRRLRLGSLWIKQGPLAPTSLLFQP